MNKFFLKFTLVVQILDINVAYGKNLQKVLNNEICLLGQLR